MSSRRLRIGVIGLGQFGTSLACELAKRAEVLAIDRSQSAINAISDKVQRAVALDVRDLPSLRTVVTPDFDEAVVALSALEASILATLHLKKIGVKNIRAKAATDDHAAILSSVGATHVIFPERETALRVAARITSRNLIDYIPLEQDYRLAEIASPDAMVGKSLSELRIRNLYGVMVVAVKQTVPPSFEPLPSADFVLKPSDILVVIGREADISGLEEGRPTQPT